MDAAMQSMILSLSAINLILFVFVRLFVAEFATMIRST
jgi:hypothetical protein